jgi:hypothetical protein
MYYVHVPFIKPTVKFHLAENLSDLNKKDRNKRHSSPFINVVRGVFFVVRVTLVPVSYLTAPSAVHSYRVPGKFIRRLKSLFYIYRQCTYIAGTEINYFFPSSQLGYWLLISRGPTKFLRAQFYFSVNEKEKSKHSDINE